MWVNQIPGDSNICKVVGVQCLSLAFRVCKVGGFLCVCTLIPSGHLQSSNLWIYQKLENVCSIYKINEYNML